MLKDAQLFITVKHSYNVVTIKENIYNV